LTLVLVKRAWHQALQEHLVQAVFKLADTDHPPVNLQDNIKIQS
jgi:hypothetical protein